MSAPKLGKADGVGGVTEEGEGVRGMGLVGEFFADEEFPFVDRSAEGEGLSYPFERVSIMRNERDG